jgi:hypothetical protein
MIIEIDPIAFYMPIPFYGCGPYIGMEFLG